MASTLKVLQGKAIVSLDDHPHVRRCFGGFHMESLGINTVAGDGKAAQRKLLIFNWDVAAEPAGLVWLMGSLGIAAARPVAAS